MDGTVAKNKMDEILAFMQREERSPAFIPISGYALREFMKIGRPSLFALYNAGWSSGFTVNGVGPA